MNFAIRVEGLSKRYRVGLGPREKHLDLRDVIAGVASASFRAVRRMASSGNGPDAEAPEPTDFWSLRDVSFEVQPGEVVGIIGRNGAGKSTLLKVLSRIVEPTRGRVTYRGRIGSLLEVGTGFHHELSGRENIYLSGSILGMGRREIAAKFDDIVEFSEIGRFLDTPVKRYSSGMYVRLAFAVAAHLDPEILIIDEVLAVGDSSFQRKCLGRMAEVGRSGRTILFVSHNMAAIANLCDRAIWLERGEARGDGEARCIIDQYLDSLSQPAGADIDLRQHPSRSTAGPALLRRLRLVDESSRTSTRFRAGDSLGFEIDVETGGERGDFYFAVNLDDAEGDRVARISNYFSDGEALPIRGPARVECRIDDLALMPGRYHVSIEGWAPSVGEDKLDRVAWLDVEAGDFFGNGRFPSAKQGVFLVRSSWNSRVLTAGARPE